MTLCGQGMPCVADQTAAHPRSHEASPEFTEPLEAAILHAGSAPALAGRRIRAGPPGR